MLLINSMKELKMTTNFLWFPGNHHQPCICRYDVDYDPDPDQSLFPDIIVTIHPFPIEINKGGTHPLHSKASEEAIIDAITRREFDRINIMKIRFIFNYVEEDKVT